MLIVTGSVTARADTFDALLEARELCASSTRVRILPVEARH